MRIVSKAALKSFWKRHPAAKAPLRLWHLRAREAQWDNFAEVRATFPHADQVKVKSGNVVTVFNAGGNNLRIVTAIHYNRSVVFVLLVLLHAEYSKSAWKEKL